MFEGRQNLIGIVLLIACGLSAGTMLGYIDAGEVARFDGPGWLGVLIAVFGIGVMILLFVRQRGIGLGNDVRSKRRWWRRDGS